LHLQTQKRRLSTSPFADAIAWPEPARKLAFDSWLQRVAAAHSLNAHSLRSASSDASFRRYFRIDGRDASFIVMDAPPPQEDVAKFMHVDAILLAADLNVPKILESDIEHGFLLVTDLGSQLYLNVMLEARSRGDTARCDTLMRDAVRTLIQVQTKADAQSLPAYDDAWLRRELALFPEWCVTIECGVQWTDDEKLIWQAACDALVHSALAQPVVPVHRDYMPRNLMVCANAAPGILDFQDAVRGPISYDVASLLRDAFISWEEEQEIDWAVRYWQAGRAAALPVREDFADFWRELEWMGLQRHLKVLGIFCRLKHRDGKPKYSEDLARFFRYAHKVSARYNALRPLSRLLEPLMGAQRVDAYY
jgi:aminoglycoside/choline kinase family phosphotransferase